MKPDILFLLIRYPLSILNLSKNFLLSLPLFYWLPVAVFLLIMLITCMNLLRKSTALTAFPDTFPTVYLRLLYVLTLPGKRLCFSQPFVHFNGSDVVKLGGHNFEDISRIRDDFLPHLLKLFINREYSVTEVTILTYSNHHFSIFSKNHTSLCYKEKTLKH